MDKNIVYLLQSEYRLMENDLIHFPLPLRRVIHGISNATFDCYCKFRNRFHRIQQLGVHFDIPSCLIF